MEAAGFTAHVIILNHSGQIKAGKAPELYCHRAYTACKVVQLEGKDWSPARKLEDSPPLSYLVKLPPLIWFQVSLCVWRVSLTSLSVSFCYSYESDCCVYHWGHRQRGCWRWQGHHICPECSKKPSECNRYTCRDGHKTICLNWPFKFNTRLITRHSKIPHPRRENILACGPWSY